MITDLCLEPSTHVAPASGLPNVGFPDDPDETCAKIAVVDDEPTNVKVVCRLLKLEGYSDFVTTNDSRDAVELIRRCGADVVLLDLMMPHISGLDVLRQLRSNEDTQLTPVVFLTASTDHGTKIEALRCGANDFLNKPIDPSELVPRIRNIVALKRHQDRLRNHSQTLEQAVRQRTAELEASRRDVIHCLARAGEYRDDNTGYHVLRVGKYARLVAREFGMEVDYLDSIEQAAQLHDIGKVGIPDDILRKPGKLTEAEFELVQRHCGFGKRILQRFSPQEQLAMQQHADIGAKILSVARNPLLEMATRIALTHHEWWDGSGYPLGLQGENIPLEGRITAVADVFDALSTRRCYKEAFPLERCFSIMEEKRGTQFDPQVLDAFEATRRELVELQIQYADGS